MSVLDMHRSQLQRKQDVVVKDMRDIAGISDKISRKQTELGRTKSSSQQQRIARDLQRLSDDRARAEKSLAMHQRQVSELSKKVASDEAVERKKALSEQRKRNRQLVLSRHDLQPSLGHSITATTEFLGMTRTHSDLGHDEHEPISAFIAYSHEDKRYLAKLHQHLSLLRNEGKLDDWHDRRIDPGQEWEQAIDDRLYNDKVILLLVSPSFLASKYCWEKEMKVAMQRHEAGEAIVIPIIVRDCDWESAPFGKLEALPEKGKPITRWSPQDSGWRNVAKGIRKVIDSLSQERGNSAPSVSVSTSFIRFGALNTDTLLAVVDEATLLSATRHALRSGDTMMAVSDLKAEPDIAGRDMQAIRRSLQALVRREFVKLVLDQGDAGIQFQLTSAGLDYALPLAVPNFDKQVERIRLVICDLKETTLEELTHTGLPRLLIRHVALDFKRQGLVKTREYAEETMFIENPSPELCRQT